jgi:hypothetical protein
MTALAAVSARDLWWQAPEVCNCPAPNEDFECFHDTTGGYYPFSGYVGGFSSFEHAGTTYITDGYVALPKDRFTGLDEMDRDINPLSDRLAASLAGQLDGVVEAGSPTRWFREPFITVLETAGFRIRPLAGVRIIHAICDPAQQWAQVGIIASTAPSQETSGVVRPAVTEAP